MPNSLTEWLAVAFASWLVLSLVSVTALSFAANRLKRVRARLCGPVEPPPEPEIVNWISVLPPVPPSNTLNSWTEYDDVALAWYAEGSAR